VGQVVRIKFTLLVTLSVNKFVNHQKLVAVWLQKPLPVWRLVEIVVVEVLLEVFQVIGVSHVMMDEVMMVVETRLEDVIGQMLFDVMRMQDGVGRNVVMVVLVRCHRRRSQRGRRRR
jgi:hypothetical protein